jgi:hypothetical protein
MTPNEFKAWFDGFTEAFDNRVPTKAQWMRVKERVAEIDGKSVTERIYLDRYWPTYAPRYGHPYWQTLGGVGLGTTTFTAANCVNAVGTNVLSATGDFKMPQSQSFNSTSAMYALGAADANALNS